MKQEDRHFLTVIRHFCERFKMKKTTFGKLAVNDFSFVQRIESGRVARDKMKFRVYQFIEEYNAEHNRSV